MNLHSVLDWGSRTSSGILTPAQGHGLDVAPIPAPCASSLVCGAVASTRIGVCMPCPGDQITYTDPMGKPTAAMQELAHMLVALEERCDSGSDAETNAATRVIEKLRIVLTRFSGLDGFTALMRRAVALSRTSDPSLADRTITQYDSIASFEGLSTETTLTVTAHLLDLMSTFIGQALTLRLLAETWPVDDL